MNKKVWISWQIIAFSEISDVFWRNQIDKFWMCETSTKKKFNEPENCSHIPDGTTVLKQQIKVCQF